MEYAKRVLAPSCPCGTEPLDAGLCLGSVLARMLFQSPRCPKIRNPPSMNQVAVIARPPARWSVVLAFGLVYLSWGTTYLAIRKGVEVFPPAVFGGSRVACAGLILLLYLALRGQSLRLRWRDLLWTAGMGILFFVGGNGLITYAEKSVPSGVASVLAATSPLWVAVLEVVWPWGERLNLRGWFGLFAGLAGVTILLAGQLNAASDFWRDTGALLVLGSAFSWAIGSFIVRQRRSKVAHLTGAAYQMFIGGSSLFLIGLLIGEGTQFSWEQCTWAGVYSFFHLLIVGSLIGFVAYNWLLSHVSTALAGTYAYVNPVVAILAGWLLNNEAITSWIVGGMAVILAGVALVRGGSPRSQKPKEQAFVGAFDDGEVQAANADVLDELRLDEQVCNRGR
jgi:drug/metabolite transporter (DMT)-like permease